MVLRSQEDGGQGGIGRASLACRRNADKWQSSPNDYLSW